MKPKQITLKEIDATLYSPGGKAEQIKKKIVDLTVREVAKRLDKSTQNVNIFKGTARPKLSTLIEFGKAVGVE